MMRRVLMTSPAFFNGGWLEVTGEPSIELPEAVADKLVKRGRAIELPDPAAVTPEPVDPVSPAGELAVAAAPEPVAGKRRNRGADAAIEAPAVEAAPAADAAGLPDLEAVAEVEGEGE